MRLGIDIGGTKTAAVILDDADSGRRAVTGAFVLSTDPAEGVRRRLQALGRKSLVLW